MSKHMSERRRWSRPVKVTTIVGGLLVLGLGAWALIAALTAGNVSVSTVNLAASITNAGAFTNDDGVVDLGDTGDDGSDPLGYGIEPVAGRDGSLATCTVDVSANSADVTITDGYETYHCTVNVKPINDGDQDLRLQDVVVTDGGGGTPFTPGVEVEVLPAGSAAGCGKTLPAGGLSQNMNFGVGLLDVNAGDTFDIDLEFQWVPSSLYDPGLCVGY